MKFIHLIWSNLKRRKLRTVLTLLSILIAFLLFGYLAAIREAFNAGVSVAGADRLVVRHRVSIIQLLPESYEARIQRIPDVTAVSHATWFGGIYQEPKNFFPNFPVVPEKHLELFPEYIVPPDQVEAWKKNRIGALIGRPLAERFKWNIGDRIPIRSPIWPRKDGQPVWEFEISAIYDGAEKGTDTTQMFFHYDYFDEARTELGDGLVGWYNVRVTDPDRAAEVVKAIDAEFANSMAETKTDTELAFVQGFAKQVGDIGAIMIAVLSAVFFTILLVAGNTMAQAVRERTEELGVLKAIGFTNRQVLLLVLGESILLAALGGFAGLAIAGFLIAGGDPTGGALPIFYFPAADILAGLLLVIGLGIVAGLLPALQAMNLRVADALRRM